MILIEINVVIIISYSIKVKFYYLETNNEIYKTKEFNLKFFETVVKKENILFLLKKNQYFDNCKHKLTYLLKYNFDIDYTNIKNFLENKIEKSITYLTNYKIIQDVYFKDTVPFFSDLNTLIFIMKKCSNSNCTTKKNIKKNQYNNSVENPYYNPELAFTILNNLIFSM